jgi:peptide/nickel transport system ATP-binding protein
VSDPLLAVEGLTIHFDTEAGRVRAVDGVDFTVEPGETVCLVGESGSGKTVTCEALTKLVPMPPGEIVGGRAVFDGTDLTELSSRELRAFRGDRIAHVFQNPGSALDPVYTVGDQLVETIRYHRDAGEAAARRRAVDLLDQVGIPNAASRADEYPHEFSGGMRQRVVVAMALANDPDLLIADEPTTALDVTIEAQLLELLDGIQAERDMAMLYVTHDLGVVAELADEVVVLYAGKVMERGPVEDVFRRPAHPYTQALLRAIPGRGERESIGGTLPDPTAPPDGCRFHPRCPFAVEECGEGDHPAVQAAGVQAAACVYYDDATRYDAATVRDAGARANGDDPDGEPAGSGAGPAGDSGGRGGAADGHEKAADGPTGRPDPADDGGER